MKGLLNLIIFFLILIFISCSTQKLNIYKDEKGKQVIVGEISWKEWQNSSGWTDCYADEYSLNREKSREIKSLITNNIEFLLFAGSWCGDSESEVPIIYKIMSETGVEENKIKLIGVDRQKQDMEGNADKFNIVRVPTLIIMNNGKEQGRIIEFPKKSWEDDIIEILK